MWQPRILNKNIISLILLMLNIFISNYCFGLPSDNTQPMMVVADHAEINYNTGISTYWGNVVADQGTSHITADVLYVESMHLNKLHEVIAQGLGNNFAHYSTLPQVGEPIMYGQAQIIIYLPDKNKILLLQQGEVHQGYNSVHGPYLIYDTQTEIAVSVPVDNAQAHIFIEPDKTINQGFPQTSTPPPTSTPHP